MSLIQLKTHDLATIDSLSTIIGVDYAQGIRKNCMLSRDLLDSIDLRFYYQGPADQVKRTFAKAINKAYCSNSLEPTLEDAINFLDQYDLSWSLEVGNELAYSFGVYDDDWSVIAEDDRSHTAIVTAIAIAYCNINRPKTEKVVSLAAYRNEGGLFYV